jgi:hypothetical protein
MKNPSVPFLVAALAAGLLINPAPARAQIYDTLGPGDTFNTNREVTFQEGSLDGYADLFTSPVTENVSSVELALEGVTGDDAITLSIRSNSGDAPSLGPDGIIGTFTPVALPSDPGVVTFEATTDFQLQADTQYWLTAFASDGTVEWFYGNQGIQNLISTHLAGSWNTEEVTEGALAFEINPVPEPGSPALCAAGLGVWFLGRYLRKLRRRASCGK